MAGEFFFSFLGFMNGLGKRRGGGGGVCSIQLQFLMDGWMDGWMRGKGREYVCLFVWVLARGKVAE